LIAVTIPFFEKRGVDSARLNAELLLAHCLGWKRIELYTRFENELSAEQVDGFRELVRRRGSREPLQHLLGRTEFYSLEFHCDRRALIPRHETEGVVEEALRLLDGVKAPLVADIGTGTGCIAVSLAMAMSEAQVVATDVSLDALEVALKNVEAHGVAGRVRLLEGDLAAPLCAEGYAGRIDLVACNPPYVARAEFERLQPEVRDFEPRIALNGGEDGLDFYRRLLRDVPRLLKAGGFAVFELADSASAEVRRLADECGWREVSVRDDLAGTPRVLSARWAPAPPAGEA